MICNKENKRMIHKRWKRVNDNTDTESFQTQAFLLGKVDIPLIIFFKDIIISFETTDN